MDFELDPEAQQIIDLVERFVADVLMPHEPALLAREAQGLEAVLNPDELVRIDQQARELGLFGMDAPEEFGGSNLSHVVITGRNIALGRTVVPYTFLPDSPNLRMLMVSANEEQKRRYLDPYARGEIASSIAISEPGAGSDPRGMRTRAVRVATGWEINGSKIWISKAAAADFLILVAVTSPADAPKPRLTSFIVDRDTPGVIIGNPVHMVGGTHTYEVRFDAVLLPEGALLGREGEAFQPMQTRLATRRLEIAAWCIGAAERALRLLVEHAKQRVTFGTPLADRQTIQGWIADAATAIRGARLLAFEIAWRSDRGEDVSTLVSMIKAQATDMASLVIDRAMQTLGAMGVSKEVPLHLMAARVRMMRIYDGPTEIHRWVVARDVLNGTYA